MLGGNDYLEVIGGKDNFANGNMGDDTFVLRGGKGDYLGGKDDDLIQVYNVVSGSSVNGNRGQDYITGFVSDVSYRGGKGNDILAVSQGEVWGDWDVDIFVGVAGDGHAVIMDYAIGEDQIDISMEGGWSYVGDGLMFIDNDGDEIMLLRGINSIEQVTLL